MQNFFETPYNITENLWIAKKIVEDESVVTFVLFEQDRLLESEVILLCPEILFAINVQKSLITVVNNIVSEYQKLISLII